MNLSTIADYAQIIDLLPLNIIILDVKNNGNAFLFNSINKTAAQAEGIGADEAGNPPFQQLFPHLAVSPLLNTLHHVYKTQQPKKIEFEYSGKSGLSRWIKCEIHPLADQRLALIYADDTDRKETEAALVTKAQVYKELLDEISEQTKELAHYKGTLDRYAIVLMTDENGIITYVSEEYEKVSGYSRTEVLGKPLSNFQHPDVPDDFYHEMLEILISTGEWEGEWIKQRKDGSDYWLRSHIVLNKNAKGKVTGYSSISHDITSKKELETLTNELEHRITEEIEKNCIQTTQMMEQSRMAQMGEMLNMIAHQWRQPLASISAIASTLGIDVMMENYQPDFFTERLNSIADLSQHLSKTIDDFRGFFKQDKQTSLFLLRELVGQSLAILGPTLENREITVITQYEDTHQILSYPNEIKQAILNILKNAEDALLENHIENKTIHIHCYESNGYGHVKIEDNAGGIPNDILDKIFEPYFSTKLQKDGTGLGLYMSKTIIDDHCGGSLSCRNTTQGACFTISIPIDSKN